MIALLLILVGLGWVLVFRYRRRNMYKLAAAIPTPDETNLLVGVAHKMMGNTEGKHFFYKTNPTKPCYYRNVIYKNTLRINRMNSDVPLTDFL